MNTESIRRYVIETVLDPARGRGDRTARVHVGEVARALNLRGRFPQICNALRAEKFLAAQALTLEAYEGPPSGLSSTVAYTYRLEPRDVGAQGAAEDWFLRLRGLLRGMYDDEGGGEAYLRRQRRDFEGGQRP